MIIRAYFMDREVFLDVPDNSLVFDGNAYVSPHQAKWVALSVNTSMVTRAFIDVCAYDIHYDGQPKNCLTWTNRWVAKVIRVETESSATSQTDISYIVDPNSGQCVCGVTCEGTEIQNVPVYVVNNPKTIR